MAEEIRAEMVANVWKVVKAAGDDVAEGDTLVILESMKMEIPVVGEADGVVAEVSRPGEAEFRMLAVAPGAQRRGAGEALVRACVGRARALGAEALVLYT